MTSRVSWGGTQAGSTASVAAAVVSRGDLAMRRLRLKNAIGSATKEAHPPDNDCAAERPVRLSKLSPLSCRRMLQGEPSLEPWLEIVIEAMRTL